MIDTLKAGRRRTFGLIRSELCSQTEGDDLKGRIVAETLIKMRKP